MRLRCYNQRHVNYPKTGQLKSALGPSCSNCIRYCMHNVTAITAGYAQPLARSQSGLIACGLIVASLLTTVAEATGQGMESANFIEDRIQEISRLFEQLDQEAKACLDQKQPAGQSGECRRFARHLDDETIALYLESCAMLRHWHESLGEETADPASKSDDPGSALEHNPGIEYACGEKALVKHTRFVQQAFDKIRRSAKVSSPVYTDDWYRNHRMQQILRNKLTDSMEAQQQRMAGQVLQLWNRLQLENLRRQNQPAVNVGTIIQ